MSGLRAAVDADVLMKTLAHIFCTLQESSAPKSDGTVQVTIISAGPGNRQDGNLYIPTAIASAVPVFNGARSFIDHADSESERTRPERTTRDLCGFFRDVHVGDDGSLQGTLVLGGAGAETARKTIETALRYQKEFPGRVWAGISVNADGSYSPDTSERLIQQFPQWRDKLEQRDMWNVVTEFTRALSADVVTLPARGGSFMSLQEAESALSSDHWRRRFRESQRTLIRERAASAATDEGALADVVYAVNSLVPLSEADGTRISDDVITDLRKKAAAVTETHDPRIIANLLDALKAFLGEEQAENAEEAKPKADKKSTESTESTVKEEGQPMKDEKAKEADKAKAEEAKSGIACEACGHFPGSKKEAAESKSKEDDAMPMEAQKKEAAGDGEPDADDEKLAKSKESESPVTAKLREAEATIAQLRTEGKMVEADRMELESLRMKEAQRTKLGKAHESIAEAGVEGVLDPERLMSFHESQWPALIDMARQTAGPARSYGSGQINMPSPPTVRTPVSAVDAFNAAFEN